jgi:hypothetical protein
VAAGAREDELEVGKGVAGADAGRRRQGNGRCQGASPATGQRTTSGGSPAAGSLAGGHDRSVVVGNEIGTQFFLFSLKI